MLDAMPYIIVRSCVFPTIETFNGITYIEYEHDGSSGMLQTAMSSLSATRVTDAPFYLYKTSQPPYVVLNRLERFLSYNVVSANSISESSPESSDHWQIWTLRLI